MEDEKGNKMRKKLNTAEDLLRDKQVDMGSEKSFGIVFAIVFVIIGVWPLFASGGIHIWAIIISIAFLVISFTKPLILRPINILWFRFGLLLHRIVNPLVMGIMFFIVITPIGLVMRIMGKDMLRIKLHKDTSSYWINRSPPGPKAESMRDQF